MKFPFVSREQAEARLAEHKERISYLEAALARKEEECKALTNAIAANNRIITPFNAPRKSTAKMVRRIDPYYEGKRLERMTAPQFEESGYPPSMREDPKKSA